ncbi:hypothetical protein QR680_004300 [Steinernema hermaphroditum]|uniref:F-box domain-containing protein n=1 Tax=Steinernema hermaphroditum TaxID=289476 RepID=A0AA39HNA4_9BILA|nr:hypothetical protein QR680_004300 [Steinernema hermaphroditum]
MYSVFSCFSEARKRRFAPQTIDYSYGLKAILGASVDEFPKESISEDADFSSKTLDMDHLPFDLVDHLLHFLPLADLETIEEEVADRPELQNWKAAAEVHLEERFFLRIRIGVLAKKDDDEKVQDAQLYAMYEFHRGKVEGIWDLKKWRYAWISNIHLGCSFSHSVPEDCTAIDLQQALQIASLPVCSLEKKFCSLEIGGIPSSVAHVVQKILNVTQKTFTEVENYASDEIIENFLVDYVFQEKFLKYVTTDLVCADTTIALIEKWMNSDMSLHAHFNIPEDITEELMDAFGIKDGVLAHPSRPCSLRIDEMVIEEHHHRDAAGVESLIAYWKKGVGDLFMDSDSNIAVLESEDDWEKLVEKYGLSKTDDGSSVITTTHPSCTGTLSLRKEGRCLFCSVSYETEGIHITDFLSLIIVQWTAGDGKYLENGKKQMEFFLHTGVLDVELPDCFLWVKFREIEYTFLAHSNDRIGLKIQKVFSRLYDVGVLFRVSVIERYPDGFGPELQDTDFSAKTLDMDQLPVDLVDHLLHFLPLTDLKTIKEEAADRPELQNWKAAAEVHLEERFFLRIDIDVLAKKDEQEAQDGSTQFYIKCKFHRGKVKGIWDRKKWRYSWISSIRLSSSFSRPKREQNTATGLEEVLRIVSLPVAALEEITGSLDVGWIPPSVADSALRILGAMQKTFGEIMNSAEYVQDFFRSYMAQETFLKSFYSEVDSSIEAAITFVDKWLHSNMSLRMALNSFEDISYELMAEFETEDEILAHPSRSCSLRIGERHVEEYAHEDAAGVESVITDWKAGDGNLLLISESNIVVLESEDEWKKVVEKYGQSKTADEVDTISTKHPSCTGVLTLNKDGRCLYFYVSYEVTVNMDDFESVIDRWKAGNGTYLANGRKKMEVLIDLEHEWFPDFAPDWLLWLDKDEIAYSFIAHPNRNVDRLSGSSGC